MSKIKLNKILLGLSLSTIMLTSNLNNCYAANVSFGTTSEGGEGDSGPSTTEGDGGYTSGNKEFKYTYEYWVSSGGGFTIDGYDLNGTSVMPTTTIIDPIEHSFKSGTWIGINITETQSASWGVDNFSFQEIRKKYTCVYSKSSTSYPCVKDTSVTTIAAGSSCAKTGYTCSTSSIPANTGTPLQLCTCIKYGTCTTNYDDKTETLEPVDYHDENPCPATKTYNGLTYTYNADKSSSEEVYESTVSEAHQNSMKEEAYGEVYGIAIGSIGGPLGKVKYIKINNYPSNGVFDNNDKGELTIVELSRNFPGASASGTATISYAHKQEKVCMNLKNAQVTYGRDCLTDEIGIPNKQIFADDPNNKYWHYFIPLNTKSGIDKFYIEIIPNTNRKLSVGECLDMMKKYGTNYPTYIIPNLTGDEFDLNNSKEYNENKIIENNGCYFATTINIPTVQKFYNEIDSNGTKKLKGFNFYYKPIPTDLSDSTNVALEVFPNGVGTNSLWKDWYDKTMANISVSPNLKTNDVTYVAKINGNLNKIRKYKFKDKSVPYTTWENMNINGSSNFISTNNDIFTETLTNYYKLGCGPANDNTSDHLYQSECGTQ